RQPVLRYRQRCGPIGESWVNEWRLGDQTLWKPRVQVKRRRLAIRRVRGKRAGLEAQSRLPDELVERNPRIVNSIASADGVLVSQPVGKTKSRAPSVVVRFFKGAGPDATSSRSCKDQGSGDIPGPRVGRVRIESRIFVVTFGARKLVVEAQTERQSELRCDFILVINPRSHIGFVEHWVDWNGLTGGVHLSKEERSKSLAGLAV